MIIIPTYDEKANIEPLVKRIRAQLSSEIIYFIDDSSPDGTAEEIRRIQKTDKNILLEVRPGKNGIGSAYSNALQKHLCELNEKYLITMDADLSHDPKYLPIILKELEEKDFVIGSRYVKDGGVKNWGWHRVLLSKFGNIYARVLSKSKIHDLTSGFTGYRAEALRKIDFSKINSDGYAFLIELKKTLEDNGATVKEIPIIFPERENGVSKLSWQITLEGFLFPIKTLLSSIRVEIILFVATFSLYAATAPRTIFFGDNAEFITAVRTLGIPHPSGYPLYIMLAKLFSFLHLGNPVLAINLFSAFCAAVSIALFYNLVKKFIEPKFAFLGSLILAVSAVFWSQAIIAEVYALNFLLLMILLKILYAIKTSADKKYLYAFALILGLSLANHEMMVLMIPAMAVPIFMIKGWSKKTLFWAFLLGILGMCAYLYMPIRSASHPALDWGQTSKSVKAFIHHVLRSDYADLGGTHSASSQFEFLSAAFLNIFDQFKWLVIIILPGIYFLFFEKRKILAFTASLLLLNIFGIILLRNIPFSQYNVDYQMVYFIPAYATVAFWISAGLQEISTWIAQEKFASLSVTTIALLAILVLAVANYPQNNLGQFKFLDDYSKNYLLSLKPNAVLALAPEGESVDSMSFSFLYQKIVMHLRPDVQIITYKSVFPNPQSAISEKILSSPDVDYQRTQLLALLNDKFAGRPLYTSYLVPGCVDNGYACEINSNDVASNNPLNVSSSDTEIMRNDFEGTDVLGNYYLHQAAYYLGKDTSKAYDALIKSITFNNEIKGLDMQSFANYRNTK